MKKNNTILTNVALFIFAILTLVGAVYAKNDKVKIEIGSKEQPLKVKASVIELSNAISDVSEKVSKTVVSIHAEKVVEYPANPYMNPFDNFFRRDPFQDFFNQNPRNPRSQPAPKRKHKQQGMGSGVIVSKQGYILTNAHVIGEADNIYVTLTDKRKLEAEIVGTDKQSDVAVIKIKNPPKNLPVAIIGNSDKLRIGEFVIAIGSPFGYSNTVTSGIVSAKGRTTGLNLFENYIQTDASINPGNSGGALLNLRGELIAINTAIASRSGGSQGIGFAIPINMAKHILEDILDDGKVKRGFLGVFLQEMDNNLLDYFGLEELKGSLVTEVIKDSPAAKAGFKPKDLIIKISGQDIKSLNHCRNLVAMLNPNKTYDFVVIRDKKEVELKVKIGERKEQLAKETSEPEPAPLGFTVENIDEDHVRKYELNKKKGVIITKVEVDSQADKAGFLVADILLEINNEEVKSITDVKKALRKTKKSALVLVNRKGMQKYIGLRVK